MNQVQFGHARFDQLAHVRRALFSDNVDDALVRGYFRRMQHEAQSALMEMSMLHLSALRPIPKVPLLVLGATNDGFFTPGLVAATAHGLGAACEIVPDMAHAMMLEPGWRDAADRIADWVERLHGAR
jgi:pimeloyl-ACP methyl ester carboxylesterase